VNQYLGAVVLGFVATILAILIVGTISTKKLHLGIPDN